eukprot:805664-Amphidinium_carterae.2
MEGDCCCDFNWGSKVEATPALALLFNASCISSVTAMHDTHDWIKSLRDFTSSDGCTAHALHK